MAKVQHIALQIQTSMKSIFFLSLLMILIFWVSCTNDSFIPSAVDCDPEDFPTYDDQLAEIIDRTCAYATCHDGSATTDAPGDYGSFAGISVDFGGSIRSRVIDLEEDSVLGMPPDFAVGGPIDLSPEDFALFSCWIEAEFPEN